MSPAIAVVAALAALLAQGGKVELRENWLLKSSCQMKEEGDAISTPGFAARGWHPTSVPATVLTALTRNGVYPDVRIGMNSFRIPDASDEFNRKHDLAKYSHLPGGRNPWKDPYWYRTEFSLSAWPKGRRLWLEFKGINYRAEVWLNGSRVADPKAMVGIYRRFRFDITDCARPGTNCLAVKIHPVDHPGEPDLQLTPYGKSRTYSKKEIQKDVTYIVGVGYDCMPAIPDRNMGIWQAVCVDTTGAVDIRDPLVAPDLPLPKTSPATLTVSADLVNATPFPQKGLCRGLLAQGGVEFAKEIELRPGEVRRVVFSPSEFPQLVIANPRLWWPKNYGAQNLYHLRLTFESGRQTSDAEAVTFGIRKITSELHWFQGTPGLRVHINGQRIFSQGGWLQPELLFEMPAKRLQAEVRYLTEANLNTVTFEDWYLKPMVSYYYYKSAFEPLHVQLSPLDAVVTVVNRRLQPAGGLRVSAKVYDSRMKLRWETQAPTEVQANTYRDVFALPALPGLAPVYFVKLDLAEGSRLASRNFYWLSSKRPADYADLARLPAVKLRVTQRIESRGDKRIVHVRLENPTDRLAFFIQLAVTAGTRGEEVLPVFWDDNYFSLVPGEAREVTATIDAEDLHGAAPVVEVGGWNVESPFDCTALRLSPTEVKAGQLFEVRGTIENTFLDGSRIDLYVDNRPVDWRMFWARGGKTRDLVFDLRLSEPGRHELRIGDQVASVVAK